MRKSASMFIFLVLGTACIIDLEPAEPDIESSATPPEVAPEVEPEVNIDLIGDRSADLDVMAVRAQALRPDEAGAGAGPGTGIDRACPGCSF